MRMFQSVSRHNSEQSTAHKSSRPTVSQLKGVSETISNWFENHRPQWPQISTVTNASFGSKLESNGHQLDHNRKFSEGIFQLLQYSGQHPSFSAHWADLVTKTDSPFPAFSLRIVYFAVQCNKLTSVFLCACPVIDHRNFVITLSKLDARGDSRVYPHTPLIMSWRNSLSITGQVH